MPAKQNHSRTRIVRTPDNQYRPDNQELYGPPSNLPWAVPISPENRAAGYEAFERFHPLFLYESILNLIGVAVLLFVARRFGHRLRTGDVFLMYFIWYPAVRFLLEFLRLDPWTQGGIPMAQIVSGAAILVAVGLLIWRHQRPERPAARPGARAVRRRGARR